MFKTLFVIAFVAISLIGSQQGFAFSDKYSLKERFDSGYKDGLKDCGDQQAIDNYKHSSVYQGHSTAYHDGYFSGSHNCDVSSNNNNSYSGDNTYTGQSDPIHLSKTSYGPQNNSDQNNRNEGQTQGNNQKVICIGICNGSGPTSGQTQGLTN